MSLDNYPKIPEVTSGALIINSDGELLLMKSSRWNDKYVVPGGHIEYGETAEQALVREVKEETGLDVFDIKFLDFSEMVLHKEIRKDRHFVFLYFLCKTKSKKVVMNFEAEDYVWISPQKALNLDLEPCTRAMIEKFGQDIRY